MKLSKRTITSPLVNGTIRKEIKFAWFPTTVIENEVEYTVWLEKYIQHYITKPFVMRYLPTYFGGINLDVPMEYLEEMEDGRSLYKKSYVQKYITVPTEFETISKPIVKEYITTAVSGCIHNKLLTEDHTKTNVKVCVHKI